VLNTVLTEICPETKVGVLVVFGGDMKWIYRVLPSPESTVLVEGFQSVEVQAVVVAGKDGSAAAVLQCS
jgi:molybdopterin-guanine dinucleotide biosynthesis protein